MRAEEDELHVPRSIVVEGAEAMGAPLVVQESLPDTVFVFPLRRAVPFPNLMMPVLLDTPRAKEIIAKAEAHNSHVLLLTQRDPEEDELGPQGFYDVGVLARVLKTLQLPDGNASAMTQGLRRARIVKFVRRKPYLVGKVTTLVDIPASGKKAAAMFRSLQNSLRKVAEVSDQLGDEFSTAVLNIEQPEQLADFTGSYFLKNIEERQQILEAIDVNKRLELALQFVLAELELAELGQKIQEEIRTRAEKAQKDYFLREQLKIIRRELGEEKDPRLMEIQRLEEAIAEAEMPEGAHQRSEEELRRLRTTPVESAEYGVIRNYLDWLTALPWSKSTRDVTDLGQAATVLDEDHYGLEEVKERILEFLAVRKLKPGHAGSILCFTGPPGVGKTSLGRSIARAMGRKFWRFSLGGMRDEAEIKGHRRTYIGAMPGRIMQGLKLCGANNPVLMLDEVDKLGSDFRGDPASALLEVLDPEQNHSFLDHYLDVSFDLSKVMFIATANVLPQIPDPLRDRMEIIELPGYLIAEKVEIARRHLAPKQLERHGLKKSQISLSAAALKSLIPLYTREAGVRELEKCIARLYRKTALAVARRKKPPGRLKVEELEKLLGPPRFQPEGERRVRVPGVAQGLAWTPFGGDVLFIEVVRNRGKGALHLTGSLGDVMSESAKLALSYLKSRSADFGLDLDQIESSDYHLHFPAGAIRKDGPSAGIAIACAFVSLMTGRNCPADLAMSGELTVVGEVLPVGGVREKVLAAHRFGIKRVVLPAENRPDVQELNQDLVAGLKFHYVDEFSEVFDLVFKQRGKKDQTRRAGGGAKKRKKPPRRKTKRAG